MDVADVDALEALLQDSLDAAVDADDDEAFALALGLEASELDAIYTTLLKASPLSRFRTSLKRCARRLPAITSVSSRSPDAAVAANGHGYGSPSSMRTSTEMNADPTFAALGNREPESSRESEIGRMP